MGAPWARRMERPTPDLCVCGRPDHQTLIRQLGDALGQDLPALPETPEQVWNRLLDQVEAMRRAADVVLVDTTLPGACGIPGCNVLHDNPADPVHPPRSYEAGYQDGYRQAVADHG